MKVGDLIKTVYRDEYAVVTKVWWATAARQMAAQFVYPSDGKTNCQPEGNIIEVVSL